MLVNLKGHSQLKDSNAEIPCYIIDLSQSSLPLFLKKEIEFKLKFFRFMDTCYLGECDV